MSDITERCDKYEYEKLAADRDKLLLDLYYEMDGRFSQQAKTEQMRNRLRNCMAQFEKILQEKDLDNVYALTEIGKGFSSINRLCFMQGWEGGALSMVWNLFGISYDTGKELFAGDNDPCSHADGKWYWVGGCGSPYRGSWCTHDEDTATNLFERMKQISDGSWEYMGRLEDLL